MKIWSKTLTESNLHECAEEVNRDFPGCALRIATDGDRGHFGHDGGVTLHEGPRSRRFDKVSLCSDRSGRQRNSGSAGAVDFEYGGAASWTEWGWWLARVFERDPDARANDYRGREDFHWQTKGRFIEPRTPRHRQTRAAEAGLTPPA